MANPPYVYLKRDGSNANADLNIDGYAFLNSSYISSPTYSGAKFGYNLLGRGDTQAASGSHNHAISGLIDIENGGASWDSTRWKGSGIKWSDANQKWEPTNIVGGAGLSDVVDDTSPQLGGDLDGQDTYGIIDITYISSQKLSSNSYNLGGITSIQETSSGFEQVSHGDSFAHGLSATPTYANVVPSGSSVNFGVSCKVDNTKIYVYLTAPGTRNVYWMASV